MSVQEQFFAAVRENDVAEVSALLDRDPSLANARIRGDATLLNEKVWVNKRVVDMEPDDDRDTPALHHAVFHGYVELATVLLDHGADIHAIAYENNHEMTPAVVLAAWEGGIEMLHLLLERGADPNSESSNGVTPLSTAIRHGMQDRVALLRTFGANDSSKEPQG